MDPSRVISPINEGLCGEKREATDNMKLIFAGTRGYIEEHSHRHRRHSSLLVTYRGKTILIDCGDDWLGYLDELDRPRAVFVTHAHPDHVGGLKEGWDKPVWASREAWETMRTFPLKQRRLLDPGSRVTVAGADVQAFPVEHSLCAPAVGLRLRAGRVTLFYVPDVVHIHDRDEALDGVNLYVGDGATLTRSLVRRRGDRLFGHTPVSTQLTWCAKAGIDRALFTHCGSEIVRDHEAAAARLQELAVERGVDAQLAYDGLELGVRH